MNKVKVQLKRLFAMLCITSLLIPLCEPLTAQAYMMPSEDATKNISSTLPDDDWPVSVDISVEGSTLTFDVGCPEASLSAITNENWQLMMWVVGGTGYPYSYASFPKGSGRCSISKDFSSYPDGEINVVVYVQAGNTLLYYPAQVFAKVDNGKISISSSYGQAAIDVIADYNEHYTPSLYTNPADVQILLNSYARYEDIISTVEEITKDCTTDIKKIWAIYDWICRNFAYDMEAFNSGETGKANNPGWVFTNRRAVCGGFANLALIMFRAAGIPCIEAAGHAESSGGSLEDGVENKLNARNHAWNIIYYENSWHYVDVTWGCSNRYYGEGNSQNTSGKTPDYKYLGMPAVMFGDTHYTMSPNVRSREVTGLRITGGKTQYFQGEELSKDYDVYYTLDSGDIYSHSVGSGVGECTDYDMNKLGKQTITVSYRGFTGTYEIEVLDAKAVAEITAEKTKTTYEVGDALTTDDIKVTAVCADKTTKEVTDFTVDTSKVNMKKAGKYTITVSGENRTTELTITVNPHIVKLDANGGTVRKDSLKVSTHNATIGSLPTPTRNGYIFQGWYTARTGGTRITATTKVTQSMVVYAQWKTFAQQVTAPGKVSAPTLKSKSSGQITMSFGKVLNANGYEIAYSTSKKFTKSTTKTATVIGTSNILTKLTPGKTYYVKVRAYAWFGMTKVYGDYSSVKNITLAPNRANAPALKNSKSKQLTVSFKKVANAKGYEITYSTNKKFTKSTTKTTTVTKTSTALKKLKKGKTYYVKVRAYVKNPSNKKVYGAYSAVKTIKIKK